MSVQRPRVLLVEDDPSLLELSCIVLGEESEVHCTSQTTDALRQIFSQTFDVLITDLNVQRAGDGLMLAVVMRYLQPSAVTTLITGFPDFTHALAAMQASLDRVLLKPVEAETLRQLPHAAVHAGMQPPGHLSLWDLVRQQQPLILQSWLKLVEQDDILQAAPLNSADRMDHMGEILEQIVTRQDRGHHERAFAAEHGRQRRGQHYRPEWVAREISLLRRTVFDAVLRELIRLDLSRLTQDLFELDERLDANMFDSLRAYGLLAA